MVAFHKKERPELDTRSQRLAALLGFLCVPIIVGAIFLPARILEANCPPSTFRHDLLPPSIGIYAVGVSIFALSLIFLPILIMGRYGSLRYSDPSVTVIRRNSPKSIVLSISGVLIGGASIIDSSSSYLCLTPENILIRRGYFSSPHQLSWDDVRTVRGWCSRAGKGKYVTGALKLSFADGEKIPYGLANGPIVSFEAYATITKLLQGKNYSYHADYTVTRELCPPALFPLLLHWPNGQPVQ